MKSKFEVVKEKKSSSSKVLVKTDPNNYSYPIKGAVVNMKAKKWLEIKYILYLYNLNYILINHSE